MKNNIKQQSVYLIVFVMTLFLNSTKLTAQCWQQIVTPSYNQGLHSAGIQQDGSLWCWGFNYYGQLGDGTTTNRLMPTRVGTDTDWAIVALGINATYAIKQNGTLWAWGSNSNGQLSDGTLLGRLLPSQVLPGTTWQKISAGENFVVAQKNDGTLWSCGNKDLSQTGQAGGGGGDSLILTQISTATDWVTIKCQFSHTLLLKSNQTVWGFGSGDLGKLATGTDAGYGVPTQLLAGTDWVQATAGANLSFFKKINGTIWGCGQNGNGNLGLGNYTIGVYSLTQIGTANDWRSVEPSNLHTMALKNNGSLWSCGYNLQGQLGNGTTSGTNILAQVGAATNWAKVRCGRQHTLALDSNGTLWAWGDNTYGQLGDGTTTNRTTPTQIGSVCTLGVNEFAPKVMRLLNNPVDDVVQLSFAYDGSKELSLYSMQGVLLVKQTVSNDYTTLQVAGLASGVYVVRCVSEEGIVSVKFVKR